MNDNNPENLILKKRLSTYRSPKGSLTKVSDELIIDIIKAWERWPGNAKSFYTSIGIKKEQLASIIKKGKRLNKSGPEKLGSFAPVEIIKSEDSEQKIPIILKWDKNKTIRFYQVNHLIEFLKLAS